MGLTQTSLKLVFLANQELWTRFENLVLMGARPGTLRTLLDLNFSDKEIQGNIKSVADRLRINSRAHRGKPMQAASQQFLARLDERYHASVLLALSHRIDMVEAIADGSYVDVLVEIYQAYLFAFRSNAHDAVIKFDTFVEVINGQRSGLLVSHECENCATTYVVRPRAMAQESKRCPFCVFHRHGHLFSELVSAEEADSTVIPMASRRFGA